MMVSRYQKIAGRNKRGWVLRMRFKLVRTKTARSA